MFTRPYKWWRHLKPKNIIGYLAGYANCDCGDTLMGKSGSYATDCGSGRLICGGCYEIFKDDIRKSDHEIYCEPHIDANGMLGYGLCFNKDCEWHRGDERFEWSDRAKAWSLKEEVVKRYSASGSLK